MKTGDVLTFEFEDGPQLAAILGTPLRATIYYISPKKTRGQYPGIVSEKNLTVMHRITKEDYQEPTGNWRIWVEVRFSRKSRLKTSIKYVTI